jgi:hypothetical protein
MAHDYATPDDFARWRDHATTCPLEALDYIIADCRAAELAMRGHNPTREGYYSDQAATYADVRRARTRHPRTC